MVELQRLFAGLAGSLRKCINPFPFVLNYTDPDGSSINVFRQLDAHEFLNTLLERMDTHLRALDISSSTINTLVSDLFTGQLANVIVCDQCGCVSQKYESFHSLLLEIKQASSLEQALHSYVQGEKLAGSNMYFCGQCNIKVPALKRTCLASAPPHLILTLKRFEFNYDTLLKMKLNNYVTFPHALDLYPYSTHALLKSNQDEHGDATAEVKLEKEDRALWEYELAGVVVHSGTAQGGHYYSYIRERVFGADGTCEGSWREYNDQNVTNFDEKRLPEQCFGGVKNNNYIDHSAYMLFYDRKRPSLFSSPKGDSNTSLNTKTAASTPV
jgi:ubiquitin C-terminal hydrolase